MCKHDNFFVRYSAYIECDSLKTESVLITLEENLGHDLASMKNV